MGEVKRGKEKIRQSDLCSIPYALLVKSTLEQCHLENNLALNSKSLKTVHVVWSVIPLPQIWPKDLIRIANRALCTWMFITGLLITIMNVINNLNVWSGISYVNYDSSIQDETSYSNFKWCLRRYFQHAYDVMLSKIKQNKFWKKISIIICKDKICLRNILGRMCPHVISGWLLNGITFAWIF